MLFVIVYQDVCKQQVACGVKFAKKQLLIAYMTVPGFVCRVYDEQLAMAAVIN